MKPWLSFQQSIAMLKISQQAFVDMIDSGLVQAHWIEMKLRFRTTEVINLKLDIMKRSNEVVK